MDSNTTSRSIKVVLLGNLGVGKTCLRSQFVHHMFTNAYKATIGGDYLTSTLKVENTADTTATSPLDSQESTEPSLTTTVNLQIWDTAGQERFNSISQAFYRGTDVVVLVYDVSNYESVIALNDWFRRFMEHCHVDRPGVVVVGNKVDKVRVVSKEEVFDILDREQQTQHADSGPRVLDYTKQDDVLEICCKRLEMVQSVFQRVAEVGVRLDDTSRADDSRLVRFDVDVAPVQSKCC